MVFRKNPFIRMPTGALYRMTYGTNVARNRGRVKKAGRDICPQDCGIFKPLWCPVLVRSKIMLRYIIRAWQYFSMHDRAFGGAREFSQKPRINFEIYTRARKRGTLRKWRVIVRQQWESISELYSWVNRFDYSLQEDSVEEQVGGAKAREREREGKTEKGEERWIDSNMRLLRYCCLDAGFPLPLSLSYI